MFPGSNALRRLSKLTGYFATSGEHGRPMILTFGGGQGGTLYLGVVKGE